MNVDMGLRQNPLQLGRLRARWGAKDADKENLERLGGKSEHECHMLQRQPVR